MKRVIKKWVAALLLFGWLGAPAFAQGTIATVDLRKVFDNYWKTKQADASIKERAAELDKTDKEMKDGYEKLKTEYQKLLDSANDQAVSADEREKRKNAAEAKLKDLNDSKNNILQFEREAQTTLHEQQRRMRDNVLGEIKAALNAKAKAAGYALVLDTAAETPNQTLVVLYSSGQNDLTDDLLKTLNSTAPPDFQGAAPATNSLSGGADTNQ